MGTIGREGSDHLGTSGARQREKKTGVGPGVSTVSIKEGKSKGRKGQKKQRSGVTTKLKKESEGSGRLSIRR